MARIVILGAGFAGHTAAVYLGNRLGKDHEITVVNKYSYFCYLPSLIWVAVGHMHPDKVRCSLKDIYDRINVHFVQGTAHTVYPESNRVLVHEIGSGAERSLDYDYLVIATGPRLDFDATPGLGPRAGTTLSICWLDHAIECRNTYLEQVERMRRGEQVTMVLGSGHATATCQGAAFEYLANIHKDLVRKKIRNRATLRWLSNEPALGDFGVGGVRVRRKGRVSDSETFMRQVLKEFDIEWEVRRAVTAVEPGRVYWEDDQGREGETGFDFAMLLPRFQGVNFSFLADDGRDLGPTMLNPGGFVLVDGFYGLDHETLKITPEAWPATYQNPSYRNIFAPGIAFAPPGTVSEPLTSPTGTTIVATVPRTGMVSGIVGRLVALNIIGLVQEGTMHHQERMSEMFTACIASMDDSLWDGSAISVLVYPVVPNHVRYPETFGRDMFITRLDKGVSSAWIKRIIHTTMFYKNKSLPGWQFIPE